MIGFRERTMWICAALLLVLGGAPHAAPETPTRFTQQGRLYDASGNPITGAVTATFRIYPVATNGAPLWTETHTMQVSDGWFAVPLGDIEPLTHELFAGPTRWLGVQVGSDPEMNPRAELGSVAYAKTAENVVGAITPAAIDIPGVGPIVDTEGRWVGPSPVYGDGSAGDLVISVDTNWDSDPPVNPQWRNVTIQSGAVLTVPSGTIIRCIQAFTNAGTIVVRPWTAGHDRAGGGNGYSQSTPASPRLGIALTSAAGARGGRAQSLGAARLLLNPGRIGGGEGQGFIELSGAGGGTLSIRCRGSITNTGSLVANGGVGVGWPGADYSGGGGGGGGIFIFATATSFTNTGTISVQGGDGGTPPPFPLRGCGGGGGIVHILAPNAGDSSGTVVLTGGTGTTVHNSYWDSEYKAFAGGGASGGDGGDDDSVHNATANAGKTGLLLTTPVPHPETLF